MLVELRVRDLGVIADLDLVIGTGMTALTGETGAGKTLVVEALELLLGGRADASIVRAGAPEAFVEGRFVAGDREVVLSRAVPVDGRSRAYVDGRMAPASLLSEIGDDLVDLHGQHAHQSLLHQAAQRDALDSFAGADLEEVSRAREELAGIDARLGELGGDPQVLARTVGLLRFQVDEIASAAITSPEEDAQLAAEESLLAHVGELRAAAAEARDALVGSDASQFHAGVGATDLLGLAIARLSSHDALADLAAPLRTAQADLEDVARELRLRQERLEEDPDRLEAVRRRLQLFADLRRKYGPSLAGVIEFARAARSQLADLEDAGQTRDALHARRVGAAASLGRAEERLGACRRQAAPKLAAAIEAHLHELALGGARLEIRIGEDPAGSDVELLLGANPGEPSLPFAKVASGGELARAMLATRLVLSAAPPTLVFDEVDAGVGGEAALAVGRALCAIGRDHQVLVVTHLAQVAAFADHQVLVSKSESEGRTVARARPVTGEDRIVELSRMLSGHPDSAAARRHAKELLAMAASSSTARERSGNLD
ncbi:MAG: DNA repair protein RecN [Acidimicrobiales bacterium]|jgi:DNA repair protein RecN (Recombination protein N)